MAKGKCSRCKVNDVKHNTGYCKNCKKQYDIEQTIKVNEQKYTNNLKNIYIIRYEIQYHYNYIDRLTKRLNRILVQNQKIKNAEDLGTNKASV